MVERGLRKLGYQVHSVADSVTALNLFLAEPNRFDLIITDQLMPRMTGLQLAEAAWKVRPELPVILLTGSIESVNAEKAHKRGFAAFVSKPCSLANVARIVREVLDVSQSAQT